MLTWIYVIAGVVVILVFYAARVGRSVKLLRGEVIALTDRLTAEMSRLRNETREEREDREATEAERRQQVKEETERRAKEREALLSAEPEPPSDPDYEPQDCRCHAPGEMGCTWK